jgi:hypothetical protein
LNWQPAPVYYNTYPGRTQSSFGNSQMIGLPSIGHGIVWYRYDFELASTVDLSTFNLSAQLNADDHTYHIFVNGKDNLSLPQDVSLTNGRWNTVPELVTLDRGWKHGLNQIFIAVENIGTTTASTLLIQPSGAPLCAKKVSAVPTLDSLGYWLTGFGILALAAAATARRRRVATT